MNATSDSRIHLSAGEARTLSEQALQGAGYAADDARILADHMLDAALCGYEYSGLPKILNAIEDARAQTPRSPLRVMHESELSVLYDGGNNCAMLTMYHVTRAAIERASAKGIALAGVCNSWMSGRSAYYMEMIARAGLVGIHSVSAGALVAPPGAKKASIGTNPIAFGFPTLGDPLVIDLGTSAFMFTDLAFRERMGTLLPEGVAIDAQGEPTRDPAQARLGALLSFGGYKGFALSLAMLGLGILGGSGFSPDKDYGYLIIAIKPDLMLPLAEFKRQMSEQIERLKATPRQAGVEEIRIPSERSFRERERNLREGITIDRSIYAALMQYAQKRHG